MAIKIYNRASLTAFGPQTLTQGHDNQKNNNKNKQKHALLAYKKLRKIFNGRCDWLLAVKKDTNCIIIQRYSPL